MGWEQILLLFLHLHICLFLLHSWRIYEVCANYILSWQFFSSTLKILFYFLLGPIMSDEKCSHLRCSCCINKELSPPLAAFNIFLCPYFSEVWLWYIWAWTLEVHLVWDFPSFHQFMWLGGKLFSAIVIRIFFATPPFFSSVLHAIKYWFWDCVQFFKSLSLLFRLDHFYFSI